MKRILPILLLVIFLYNSVGYYFIFQVQKYEAKREVKLKLLHRIPEHELTLLSFHTSSLEYKKIEWIEDHEFRYHGQLYDIVKSSLDVDDNIHYYCVNDKQEEKLFANLDEQIKNETTQNQANKKKSLKKVASDYLKPSISLDVNQQEKTIYFKQTLSNIPSFVPAISTPPPQVFFA